MKTKDNELEFNEVKTTLSIFRKNYNENIPSGFPRASFAVLRKFKIMNTSLFKKSDEWSVDKHRKKLMDWLLSHEA